MSQWSSVRCSSTVGGSVLTGRAKSFLSHVAILRFRAPTDVANTLAGRGLRASSLDAQRRERTGKNDKMNDRTSVESSWQMLALTNRLP